MDLILKSLYPDAKDVIFKWISNASLRKMIGTRGEPNKSSHEAWFLRKLQDAENITKIIVYENKPVGLIGTNQIDDTHKNAEIYIYIGEEEYRHLGIASAAIALFKNILFNELNLHKIYARVFAYNTPSIQLFKKNGFIVEGIQREQIYVDHKYWDVFLFGYLKDDPQGTNTSGGINV